MLRSGWSTRADIPISVGSAAKASSATPFSAMPLVDRARVARAERLLQQAGRDDERRAEEEEERQPDCGEPPAKRSSRCGSAATASQPPASAIAIGVTSAKPTSMTASCTRLT